MTKQLRTLVVDDNPDNLQACQIAADRIKDKEVVAVSFGLDLHLSLVGDSIEVKKTADKEKRDTINVVNELLSKGEFPAISEHKYTIIYERIGEMTDYVVPIKISAPAKISPIEYFQKASEALKEMQRFDAVVTDFLFKGRDDDAHIQYSAYLDGIQNSILAFREVVRNYYKCNLYKAEARQKEALDTLRTGRISKMSIRNLMEFYSEDSEFDREQRSKYEQLSANLPNVEPEFAYGGPVMIEAQNQGKPSVLVTNLHRHAGQFDSVANSIDGVVALLPLIEREIISVWGAINDMDTRYAGEDYRGRAKSSPKTWEYVLAKVVMQSTD